MLRATAERFSGAAFAPTLVVGGEEHRFFIKRQLDEAGIALEAILLEPEGRNTAAAAALAAVWLIEQKSDEILLLAPADHVIGNSEAFLTAIEAGLSEAENDRIVTFGIIPTRASTEYGYIETEEQLNRSPGARAIKRFVEKPDAATAEDYVSSGHFFWNSGIFLVKASVLLKELESQLPDLLSTMRRAVANASVDEMFVRPDPQAFREIQGISIDYGIMENTDRGVVIPVDMGWSDVGSWSAVWQILPKDGNGNVLTGNVIAIDSQNSLLRSDGGAVLAAVGAQNLAIVAVRDAVLVAPLDRVADVRMVVDQLQQSHPDAVELPSKVARPWGSYETVDSGPRFQIKHIVVDPGESLSLQMHMHRSEHWVVVRGTAEVTVGNEVKLLQENESTFIPPGTRHRLANPGKVALELVEVQCGPYLGEDDIVRFQDDYGRS